MERARGKEIERARGKEKEKKPEMIPSDEQDQHEEQKSPQA